MLKLPYFHRTKAETRWVRSELRTAHVVRTLWEAASPTQRRDPGFLALLARCAWVNRPQGSDEASRRLRNQHLAEWLGLSEADSDTELALEVAKALRLSPALATRLVRTHSGITDYYKPLRPAFLERINEDSDRIAIVFGLAAKPAVDPAKKAREVTRRVLAMPLLRAPAGGLSSMLNGLSPVLACLDPQRRLPIMNARTARLLSTLGEKLTPDGAAALTGLIGQYGIRHAFDLDVYAFTRQSSFPPARKAGRFTPAEPKTIGLKAEEASVAVLRKTRLKVRRQHNHLLNRFIKIVRWQNPPRESEFDAVIDDWTPGRRLLVEAKPSVKGPTGRAHLRQAIGQLFDYRWRNFRNEVKQVDLALLTPSKPDEDTLNLLKTLQIEALWFERNKLQGTISLTG